MRILIDSREQQPFTFQHERYFGVETEAGTLSVGDYSLAGLTDKVAVERKTLDDLLACLSRERERFERELQRAAAMDSFCVVVESSWTTLANGQYRCQMNPHAACQSVAAFMARYRIPFMFCGSRAGAEYVCWSFLRQYLEGARKRWTAIVKAHGDIADSGRVTL
ncbi:MAG: hypothetical protein FWH34_01060 [Desulfovibrionaceae bacterium]|nr:hypothetical protein [Desulfovibrionaceae bacterium]